ncbi:MAG TPA: hypothetical protein VFK90_10750 [Anaeromyxobacter sp.]|nr:hypothetical protein [Anaeromyxobacter sp.]
MPGRSPEGASARRTARAHLRVAAALRKKGAACVAVAKAFRTAAEAARREGGPDGAREGPRELEAAVSLRFARTEEREAATCEQEARTAESRAARAAARSARAR